MFSNLTDFGRKRSAAGALGFYIAYFVIFTVAGMVLSAVLYTFMPQYSARESRVMAVAIASLFCLALSLLIIQSKSLNTNVPIVIFALCSTVLAGMGGAALGLLVPTVLTVQGRITDSPRKKKRK